MRNFWRIAGFLFLLFGGQFTLTAMAQRIDPCADVYDPHMRVDCAFARIATPSYGYYGRGQRYPYRGYRQNYDGLTVCDFSECRGLVGTFHAHKGKELHFRPFDPSDRHMGIVEGGALGAGSGAVIGKVAGGNKGAAIGAVSGAAVGGLVANSKQHNNCLRIRSNGGGTAEQASQSRQTVATVQTQAQAEYEEGPLQEKLVRNLSKKGTVRTRIGPRIVAVVPSGQEKIILVPEGTEPWFEGLWENPQTGRIEPEVIGYGRGKTQLPQNSGWVIFDPNPGN